MKMKRGSIIQISTCESLMYKVKVQIAPMVFYSLVKRIRNEHTGGKKKQSWALNYLLVSQNTKQYIIDSLKILIN